MRRTVLAALAMLMAGTSASLAVEKLKVAVPQRGFWDSTWVEFGEAAGFFKDAGLEVEVFYTEGGAQTIATVASGSCRCWRHRRCGGTAHSVRRSLPEPSSKAFAAARSCTT